MAVDTSGGCKAFGDIPRTVIMGMRSRRRISDSSMRTDLAHLRQRNALPIGASQREITHLGRIEPAIACRARNKPY